MKRGTRLSTILLTTLGVVVAGAGASFGVLALTDLGDERADARAAPDRSTTATPTTTATFTPSPSSGEPSVTEPAEPGPLLERGDRGRKVRALQHRLSQIAWFLDLPNGTFDGRTEKAVRGFQRKRGFEVTGEVDRRTWKRVVQMTREPTRAELFNTAGPALFRNGDGGAEVREIQARLRQIGWFYGDVTDHYGNQTVEAVRGFQEKRRIPTTGAVDRRTLDLLHGMTREPTRAELANRPPDPADGAALDPRCLTGRALCIDKSSNSLRWVVGGDVQESVDVRFGREGMETREGRFAVKFKSRDHVSSIYDTPMPFALFFSGGQAVHYSPDFAANGYDGASHGCVNVRDYDAMAALFEQVAVGDKVVVYWS